MQKIIYEFKYTQQKGFLAKILNIFQICFQAILLFLLIYVYIMKIISIDSINILINEIYTMKLLDILYYVIVYIFGILIILFLFNGVFLRRKNAIYLYENGMKIKSANCFLPFFITRFYPYGSFSFVMERLSLSQGLFFISLVRVRVCDDINSEYKLLDFTHSRAYFFIFNDIEQCEKLIKILREKSIKALENNKLVQHIDEKIRYKNN
ncbi:hypothetical protein DCO58_04490 [Helicobacter saguini]|uniref:Uncharacterized protein n=1 Tax=Helicobacter saguini TaxID=1548018 RepID=A0A347VSS0_9HELI|nr:hypothetical protein [Helicobacter saguini]MWV62387.1 hypothetical protein [Helicobacter saguini]MWV66941.1 hypothetical protein [Helicobacter saguini]MWV69289.1 hypothetical protein [Helicobacter saguini]MWV71155.1 hypothetical protein [Helicobacter saguini]TLD94954.1 hypothetical protein LS64_003260 [Helicobacter saguini]